MAEAFRSPWRNAGLTANANIASRKAARAPRTARIGVARGGMVIPKGDHVQTPTPASRLQTAAWVPSTHHTTDSTRTTRDKNDARSDRRKSGHGANGCLEGTRCPSTEQQRQRLFTRETTTPTTTTTTNDSVAEFPHRATATHGRGNIALDARAVMGVRGPPRYGAAGRNSQTSHSQLLLRIARRLPATNAS